MCRRVSAGELEQRYKLKHLLLDFFDEMRGELMRHLEAKGFTWKDPKLKKRLEKRLKANVRERDWVDVANYAFMLHDVERSGS